MELDEYLKAIEACPDDELADRLRVHDNFPILLYADQKKIFSIVDLSGKYVFKEDSQLGKRVNSMFDYNDGTVNIEIRNLPYNILGAGKELNKILGYYPTSLIIHDYQKKKMKDVSGQRAIARVVGELSNLFMNERVPFSLPNSAKFDDMLNDNLSAIVFFKP